MRKSRDSFEMTPMAEAEFHEPLCARSRSADDANEPIHLELPF